MADYTVSNDVDALMRSADNAAIKTQLDIFTPEAVMNPVVEGMGLLNAFKGSSAAYSLRDLTGDDPNVVDVRRASDDTTATFKASEMGSVVENWVNATVALPLDTASGASAAYSLRDLTTTRSDITVTDDTTGQNTFTLNGATGAVATHNGSVFVRADGSDTYTKVGDSDVTIYPEGSLGNWRFKDVGVYARTSVAGGENPWDATWDDALASITFDNRETTGALVAQVRRSADDEIKSFTAADVAGTALTDWVNTDVVKYASDFSAGSDGWTQSRLSSLLGNNDGISDGVTSKDNTLLMRINTDSGVHRAYRSVLSDHANNSYRVEIEYYIPSSNVDVRKLRLLSSGGGAESDWSVVSGSNSTVGTWTTVTFESDAQSGANSNLEIRLSTTSTTSFTGNGTDEVYIASVKSTQTTASGHVVTWYDQSGNANHATQATDASQPKIVDGGTLVSDGLKFDGVDDAMNTSVVPASAASLVTTVPFSTIFGWLVAVPCTAWFNAPLWSYH